jgi:hypothetical protein
MLAAWSVGVSTCRRDLDHKMTISVRGKAAVREWALLNCF